MAAMAPSAQAFDLGRTISSAAQTAAVAGQKAKPVAEGIVGPHFDKKVKAAGDAVKAGTDAVKAGHDLVS
ncbi:hypothetical protein [Streptomyces sp. TLI_146]|uniref:hypothetical protein n=1 Tax=Streptomyces sp. TLI_146 TaxID=1938858 RepID=UPI00117EE197|nr:hypothetical protein [Streptomyces sp. TLI_146]